MEKKFSPFNTNGQNLYPISDQRGQKPHPSTLQPQIYTNLELEVWLLHASAVSNTIIGLIYFPCPSK